MSANGEVEPRPIVVGASVALFVALLGVLEAALLPFDYRSSATVAVDGDIGQALRANPLAAARVLSNGTFDAPLLRELSSVADGPAAQRALSIERSIRITSADARSFGIACTDRNPDRARRLCELVSNRAAASAPRTFDSDGGDAPPGPPVRARVVAASTLPRWPTATQGWLLLLAAGLGLASGSAVTVARTRRRAPDSHPGVLGSTTTPSKPSLEPAPSPEPSPQAPPVVAATPEIVAPAPAADPMRPASTLPLARSPEPVERAPLAPAAPRVEPLLPPPDAAFAPRPEDRRLTPVGLGAPEPPAGRHSTLILGSPIRPSPIPPRPSSEPPAAPGSPMPRLVSPASSRPPLDRAASVYRYVSTPVPPPPDASKHVALRDVAEGFAPDPALNAERHKPWRRQLFTLGVEQCFVTVVTSVGDARRAKARVAAELAFSLAETGHARVLLVEADLALPELHRLLGLTLLEPENLARQIAGQGQRPGPWSLLRCKASLHALVQAAPADAELVAGEGFRDCVVSLSSAYDFIVLSGPPSETGLAHRAFTGWVDGVVVVADDEGSPRAQEASARFVSKRLRKVVASGIGLP